jgi:transcriptional regulator with XRE-family HTH domain
MSPAEYKKERQRRGLTQSALAALLGIARETVSRREKGRDTIAQEAALALRSIPSANAKVEHE